MPALAPYDREQHRATWLPQRAGRLRRRATRRRTDAPSARRSRSASAAARRRPQSRAAERFARGTRRSSRPDAARVHLRRPRLRTPEVRRLEAEHCAASCKAGAGRRVAAEQRLQPRPGDRGAGEDQQGSMARPSRRCASGRWRDDGRARGGTLRSFERRADRIVRRLRQLRAGAGTLPRCGARRRSRVSPSPRLPAGILRCLARLLAPDPGARSTRPHGQEKWP